VLLSVVIPVYNEGKIILRNLEKVDDYLRTLGINYEIILVNDGSTDNTLDQAKIIGRKNLYIISYAENKGKGYAVNRGMTAALGEYRLFMDMDLSTELNEIPRFLKYICEERCDICVGNRHSVGLLAQQRPWHRALMGKVFACLSSFSSGCQLDDFTCGFKIFTAQACEKIFPRQQIFNWAFDTELICIAHQLGLRILQKPVEWSHHDNSKIRFGSAMITSLISLVKIWQMKGCIK
jgi:dolichyl-phosphate beta-glucosyltransferase